MRVFAILPLACAAAWAAPPFTLEQVLSSPFPSSLVTNGHGKIAWVERGRGVRNVWTAEAPGYRGRQITAYTEDDGQEISDLALSKDGAFVVFTRGEGANGAGEVPNPRHVAAGIEQTIFTVPISGGSPREVGKGHTPAISPNGKTIAFISGSQVWSAPSDGSAKAAQLIHARGSADSLDWSPDGTFLVFTSDRTQHSFVAVYRIGEKTAQYLDPGVDRDMFPVCSPDSRQVAFVRVPTTQDAFAFGPRRTAETPWSIRAVDVSTGKSREIWHAEPGQGSEYREITSHFQVQWAAADRLVFPWERTGWTHLYSTSVKDGGVTELSPGSSEVEDVALSIDGRSVFYSSNQNDIDRRHVWRANVSASGAPERLTTGAGLEWSPVEAAEGVIALLHSSAQQPARTAVLNKRALSDTDSLPDGFPASALIEPQGVIFSAADGMEIHGQLFLPRDGSAKHPAVIFVHGGSRRQMLLGWHYMFYYHQAYAFNQYLASRGYVVLSINYRSGIGYGLNFREALEYGATGGSEFHDVVGAGLYLRSREDVLPNKIGLWGGSYGGYLTAMGLARASNLFAAGVDLHGVHEWNEEIRNFVPAYDPQKRADVARVAFESSPMASVSTWRSPVLLIHGDDDRNVNFRQTLMLVEALRKQNVKFEELVFPDEVHDFLTHENWLTAYHASETFLGKYLRDEASTSRMTK